jgi:hypothetical protein
VACSRAGLAVRPTTWFTAFLGERPSGRAACPARELDVPGSAGVNSTVVAFGANRFTPKSGTTLF